MAEKKVRAWVTRSAETVKHQISTVNPL